MSSDKIYLTREEQIFLMEMLGVKDPIQAAEKFAVFMIEERADPQDLQKYVKKIIKNYEVEIKKYIKKTRG